MTTHAPSAISAMLSPRTIPDSWPLPPPWRAEAADDGTPIYVNDDTGVSTVYRCRNARCGAPFVPKSKRQETCGDRNCLWATAPRSEASTQRKRDRFNEWIADPANRKTWTAAMLVARRRRRAGATVLATLAARGPLTLSALYMLDAPDAVADALVSLHYVQAIAVDGGTARLTGRMVRGYLRMPQPGCPIPEALTPPPSATVAAALRGHTSGLTAPELVRATGLAQDAVQAALDAMRPYLRQVARAGAEPAHVLRPRAWSARKSDGPTQHGEPVAAAAPEMPPEDVPPVEGATLAAAARPADPEVRPSPRHAGLYAGADGRVYVMRDGLLEQAAEAKSGTVAWDGHTISRPRVVAAAWHGVDGIACAYCGVTLTMDRATVDHRTPTSRGGGEDAANLVWCCKTCNGRKAGRTAEEYAAIVAERCDPWAAASPAYGTHLPGAGLSMTLDPRPTPIALGQARGLHGLMTTVLNEGHNPQSPAWALVPWPEGCGWGVYLRSDAHVAALARTTREGRLFDRPVRVTFGSQVRLRAPAAREPGRYLLRIDAVTPVTIRSNGGANFAHLTPDATNLLSALTATFPARIGLDAFDPAMAAMRVVARATQPETVLCGSHFGAIRGWTGSVVVECNAVAAWLLECAARVGLGGRTAMGFGRVKVAPATVADLEAIGHDLRGAVSQGRWFFTPHAIRRFASRALDWDGADADALPESVRRKALAELVLESERAHFVRTLPARGRFGAAEMWRGAAPRRLRFLVGSGEGPLPALLTVLSEHDEREASAPAEPTPMQRAAWPISPAAANDYVRAVGVTQSQARRAIALDMAHATPQGEAGNVERWRGPDPVGALYEVERDGNDRTVVRVRVEDAG